jgi:hypothetical protein
MCNFNEILKNVTELKSMLIEQQVLRMAKNPSFGIKLEDNIELELIDNQQFAKIDPNSVYYYYDGPLDDKTRNFCAELLLLGKFFTQVDIDNLSKKAKYNVDLYFGGFNCRHKWKRARIKGRIEEGYVPNGPTTNQINNIGKKSIIT